MKPNYSKFVELLGERHRTILRPMSRIANALAVVGLAVALAGLSACEPVQNPNGTGAGNASKVGTSNSYGSTSGVLPTASSGTIAGGTIDSPQSQGLSEYFK